MKKLLKKIDIHRFAKYMTGGALYFWGGYAIFAACYSGLHWWWLWAKAAGDIIGWSMNYLVQRYWAFSDRTSLGEMEHAGRYVTIALTNFAIDYALIGGLKHIGISPYIGAFVSSAFFTVWSFLWYKYWVFPERHNVLEEET